LQGGTGVTPLPLTPLGISGELAPKPRRFPDGTSTAGESSFRVETDESSVVETFVLTVVLANVLDLRRVFVRIDQNQESSRKFPGIELSQTGASASAQSAYFRASE